MMVGTILTLMTLLVPNGARRLVVWEEVALVAVVVVAVVVGTTKGLVVRAVVFEICLLSCSYHREGN